MIASNGIRKPKPPKSAQSRQNRSTRADSGCSIRPFLVMDVLERALSLEREGRSIVHLEIGEPDFPTPRGIVEAAEKALRENETHYTDSRGLEELRVAIAKHYKEYYGVDVPSDRIIVTMGTSPALLLVSSLLIENSGDEVIIGDPGYPCYPNAIKYLGGVPHCITTDESNGFQLDPRAVKRAIGSRTRAIIVNSPSNPSGTLLSAGSLEEICDLGIPVISDEIYHGLVYCGKEHSALEYSDSSFVLNGFSKRYAMTGWRLGWIVAPKSQVRKLQILQQNFFISASSFVQRAAISALTQIHPEISEMRCEYDRRRRYLLSELPKIGLSYGVEPSGAFYFLVDASHIEKDSLALAFDILEKAGVALTPGIDFGKGGEGHLRISYANSIEMIREAIERLGKYMELRSSKSKGPRRRKSK